MTCRAQPRVGITPALGALGEGVRSDARGTFLLDAPAGDIAVWCEGIWSLYSDGLRMITLASGQRVDIDVPVVAKVEGPATAMASMGADLAPSVLVPRLISVRLGGPAAAAGFADGDVINAVDGAPVAELSVMGVWVLIVNRAPETKVKLSVTRAGKAITGELVLGPAH